MKKKKCQSGREKLFITISLSPPDRCVCHSCPSFHSLLSPLLTASHGSYVIEGARGGEQAEQASTQPFPYLLAFPTHIHPFPAAICCSPLVALFETTSVEQLDHMERANQSGPSPASSPCLSWSCSGNASLDLIGCATADPSDRRQRGQPAPRMIRSLAISTSGRSGLPNIPYVICVFNQVKALEIPFLAGQVAWDFGGDAMTV